MEIITFTKAKELGLSDENHISNAPKDFFKDIYGLEIVEHFGEPHKGEDILIKSWADPEKEANIVIYALDNDKIIWEPNIERLIRLQAIKTHKPTKYMFGYIDGRNSHLGIFSKGMTSVSLNVGYSFWHEFK